MQRREGDPDKTETFKEEEEGQQHRTVDGHEGSHSAHTLNITSGTGSTPLTSTEGRTYYTHSQRSKRKSVARKRPCRQNSLTSCSQKAAQVPEPRMETTPRGECLASIPPGGAQVNTAKPTTTGDEEGSTSCLDAMNSRNEASLKGLNVIASQEDKKKESSACEPVQGCKVSFDKNREEESLPSLTFSPVRKIQRRVRVCRRKTRKVDTCGEYVKPTDLPDSCMLKLWELFQSSDDMDGEFMGFEH